ncbi:MAG: AAA family ATPase [Candidatus Heimdallarchaeota archaeon]|nr:AAA family ATPase [Candidatus Heimdallarchaeota archaeon]
MSEIYYNNLGEFKNVPKIMSDVFDGLSPFYKYLAQVRQHLEQQIISFQFVHLDENPLETQDLEELISKETEILLDGTDDENATKTSNEILNSSEGYWIQLDDEEVETNNNIMETIFSDRLREVYDKRPKNRYWTDEITIIDRYPKYAAFLLERKPTGNKLFLRPNTYQIDKIISAIRLLQDRPSSHHIPLIRLFQQVLTHVDWPEIEPNPVSKYYFLNQNRSGVEIQREFTHIALKTPDFAILNGPPGTGKTQVICEIIVQEILKGKKVILVASTHIAVDNVLERILGHPEAEKVVFPIRIGDEKNVSEELKKYRYTSMRRTERDRIRKQLRNLDKRNQAQDILYTALGRPGSERIIDQTILDAANLVCGTSIGILQYPPIKFLQNSMPEPLFDVMILDEASKTPFYEFLVPALYAKKWILTGDPKQLSPYVEETDIKVSIQSLLGSYKITDDNINATLPILSTIRGKKFHLVLTNRSEIIDLYRNHMAKIRRDPEITRRMVIMSDILKENLDTHTMEFLLWSSSLVVCHIDDLHEIHHIIPGDVKLHFHLADGQIPSIDILKSIPREFLQRIFQVSQGRKERYFAEISDDWFHEIGYRLARKFELRNDPERGEYIEKEIRVLIPPGRDFAKNLKNVRQVFFPSVLESLLEGFELDTDRGMGTTLTDGLPEEAKSQRFRLLEFQHRMHSDISKFPSKYIYKGESLLNAEGIDQQRSPWMDASRIKWLQVKRKEHYQGKEPPYNHAEVEVIRNEIQEFEQWANKNRKQGGEKWTVAILTFYRAQEKELRYMLRKLYNKHRVWRTFYRENIVVEVCTVDRFQGHEADLVYLSFVNNTRSGFLDVPNRLNVAITRARYQLILVGYQKYFADKTKIRCRSEYLKLLANKVEPIDRRYDN